MSRLDELQRALVERLRAAHEAQMTLLDAVEEITELPTLLNVEHAAEAAHLAGVLALSARGTLAPLVTVLVMSGISAERVQEAAAAGLLTEIARAMGARS